MAKITLGVLDHELEVEIKHSWIFLVITLLLGVLKLTGVLNIPFWMVVFPALLPAVFLIFLVLVVVSIGYIASLFPSKRDEEEKEEEGL